MANKDIVANIKIIGSQNLFGQDRRLQCIDVLKRWRFQKK